jgi:hypothetical protein
MDSERLLVNARRNAGAKGTRGFCSAGMVLGLTMVCATGCGAPPGTGPGDLNHQERGLVKKMSTTYQYKFQRIPSMAEAYEEINDQFDKVNPQSTPQTLSFRDSVVLLYAGELARKAGYASVAKNLGTEAKNNAVNFANGRVATLKTHTTYGTWVTQADAAVQSPTVLLANPPIWRKDLWEPEPPI